MHREFEENQIFKRNGGKNKERRITSFVTKNQVSQGLPDLKWLT